MSVEITEITDHAEIAKSRLITQFQDSTNINLLIDVFVSEIQELETVLFDLLTKRDLDSATGKQLEIIGEHVGVKKLGRPDEEYRARIKLQISINISKGTESDVASIVRRATNATAVHVREDTPAHVQIWSNGDVFDIDVLETIDKVLGTAISAELLITPFVAPFVFEGDPQGSGFGSIHASSGGTFSEHFDI